MKEFVGAGICVFILYSQGHDYEPSSQGLDYARSMYNMNFSLKAKRAWACSAQVANTVPSAK